jgi:lipopolysaccharide/colanic/teichoic acid biosynthesis glycosyltransferase
MSRAIKRVLDMVFAATAFVVLSPVLLIAAIAIRVCMGRPVLFRHTRAGFCGQPFVMLKFRTMTDEKDESGCLLSDVDRLTRLGRLLRKTSIDELPQLWNVLKGEMSFVGPRPLPLDYLDLYTPEQRRRHDVPPGVMGWTAIQGRCSNSWDQRFKLDLWYVDNWSLLLDLKILFMAVPAVLSCRDTNEDGEATSSPFRGSERSRDQI